MDADIVLIQRLFSGKYDWTPLTEKRRAVYPNNNINAFVGTCPIKDNITQSKQ
jgi:hypothetical protein